MSNLVTELRERDQAAKVQGGDMLYYGDGDDLARRAADELEHLSALWIAETRENERLRWALEEIIQAAPPEPEALIWAVIPYHLVEQAGAALAPSPALVERE